MHNQIYDMDKQLCFSDGSMSVPSPCSSISSSTSGYSTSNNAQTINFSQYNMPGGDINMIVNSLPPAPPLNPDLSQLGQRVHMNPLSNGISGGYVSQLIIHEQPTEKFRFRYKSEMHGTHGSLNGERSEKNKKTFPEVELINFSGTGVIRCSLYQTNMDKPSPHSHQLVVRKDDTDECDPHDVIVGPDKGYIARFENMGIIHTAKKNICDALFCKKMKKLKFEMAYEKLSQSQEKTLREEAEREGKLMNLNQVRLCFEAFKVVDGKVWTRICEPVFSRPINNRKSALTGELKICRLSTVVGSAAGGEDLILLVEKVSKKNIQVRFYELHDDDVAWEAYGDFSDADVHHQYAITVRTPAYKNKDIVSNVTVNIELVRKSDDERSQSLSFRYKPRDVVLSRKRRRTSYMSSSSTPVSSSEIPETVNAVTTVMPPQYIPEPYQQQEFFQQAPQTISQEFNREECLNGLLNTCQLDLFVQSVQSNSDELGSTIIEPFGLLYENTPNNFLQMDGEASRPRHKQPNTDAVSQLPHIPAIRRLMSVYNNKKDVNRMSKILQIFEEYTAENDNRDTIVHDVVKDCLRKDGVALFEILRNMKLDDLLTQTNNHNQTPLHFACANDHAVFISPLLNLKCDPNVQDTNSNTALHIAVSENFKNCVESFASFSETNKINVNLANDKGFTPLHLAIRNNNLSFVQILLTKFNASVKVASSCDGNNALHLAVQHQSKDIVKYLLEHSKVDVKAKNRSGHTAEDLAKGLSGNVKQEIIDLLSEKMPPSNDDDSVTTDSIKDEPDDENDSETEEDDEKSKPEVVERSEEGFMKRLLQDDKFLSHLARLLNVDSKWKKLGIELKLDHLFCLWSNAEAMLQHIAAVEDVTPTKLINALKIVDQEAASIATALMKNEQQ